jgi:hypothetical protein
MPHEHEMSRRSAFGGGTWLAWQPRKVVPVTLSKDGRDQSVEDEPISRTGIGEVLPACAET